jgi:hypothetical protein
MLGGRRAVGVQSNGDTTARVPPRKLLESRRYDHHACVRSLEAELSELPELELKRLLSWMFDVRC